MSVHWPIVKSLLSSPGRVAIVDDRGEHSAGKVLGGALHIAALIESTSGSPTGGGNPGEPRAPVGVLMPTGAGFAMTALASWILGRTVVPLNYLLKPEELQYVIDDCGTEVVLTVGAMLDFMKFTPRVANLVRLDEQKFEGVPEARWPAMVDDDDLALLLYTSGTSGKPKGVMLTHGNIVANVRQIVEWVGIKHGDDHVFLGVLPQFHTFGLTALTILPLSLGFKVVYLARFMPGKIVKALREHRPTLLIAIPSMYAALANAKDATPEDWASLRFVVSGGEPLPQSVFERLRDRFGVTLNEGYGLTETAPVSNWCRPQDFKRGSVGMALPGVTERIVDVNTGKPLGPNEDGEVQIMGPNVMRGYYKLPTESAGAFTSDGFFRTGDIGRFDLDGHLYITGRLKEMMIVGGENVFPREIEEVLNRHASVAASGVIGVHDPVRGELPVAFVEIREGGEFDERELQSWCRQSLAGYKVPDRVIRLDELPKNPTGKIMRRELKNRPELKDGGSA
ncbi:MAG: class I adenylate-forming enzyme family protein [Phycisphaerales bacterium]